MVGEFSPQGVIVGETRNKRYPIQKGSDTLLVGSPRTSKVIIGTNEFGDEVFIPLPGLKLVASSLLHLVRSTQNLLEPDIPVPSKSFSSAIHQKTTIPGTKFEEGDYRPEKIEGIGSKGERDKIAKLRIEKTLMNELKRNGITEGKLFLLMYILAHSQTQYQHEQPVKTLSGFKKNGFGSTKERREMEKQRRRNNRLRFG